MGGKRGRKPGFAGRGRYGLGVKTKPVRIPADLDYDSLVRLVETLASEVGGYALSASQSPRWDRARLLISALQEQFRETEGLGELSARLQNLAACGKRA